MTKSGEPINPHSWKEEVLSNINKLEPQIKHYLYKLTINSFYLVNEVKSCIFLLVFKLFDSGKLECKISKNNLVFTKIDSKGKRESIQNLKAWLKKIIWRYLLKLHEKANRSNSSIPIDEHPDSRKSPLDYAQHMELRRKLNELSKEECRILELCFFERLSFHEIAIRLESEEFPKYTEEALRKKKQRALEKLRLIY
jgi:hypothetical protein